MKITSKKIFLIAYLITLSLAQGELCPVGCLSCDENKVCYVCDFFNKYVLNTADNTCTRKDLTDCQVIWPFYDLAQQKDICYKCVDGFYVDNGGCVAIVEPVPNCQIQSNETTCSVCIIEFHLSGDGTECLEVTTPIQHCFVHSNSAGEECVQCQTDYVLSFDKKSCVQEDDQRFCQEYSYLKCNKCSGKTFTDENAYLNYYFNLSTGNFQNYFNVAIANLESKLNVFRPQICQNISAENCASWNSMTGVCTQCDAGYYLDNQSKCILDPQEPIPNCLQYMDNDNCSVCEPGYHLNGSIECVQNTVIVECVLYSQTSQETVCMECAIGFYLVNKGCSERQVEISECQEYEISEELCKTCGTGQLLTSDKKKCLPVIENCTTYSLSNINSQNHDCIQCANGYYVNDQDNVCESGNTEFCKIYQTFVDVCVECVNEYYLQSGICEKNSGSVTGCDEYSSLTDSHCDTCVFNYIQSVPQNGCIAIEEILDCKTYVDFNVCQECNLGFVLTSNSCVGIPSTEHCLKKSGDDCIQCETNYLLMNGDCVEPLPFQTTNCFSSNVDGFQSSFNCLACDTGSVPYNFKDTYTCQNTNTLPSEILNCNKYNWDGTNLSCQQCLGAFILSEDHQSCLDVCPVGQTHYFISFSVDLEDNITNVFYNKCRSEGEHPNLIGCATATTDPRKSSPVCIKCKSGYIPEYGCTSDLCLISQDTNFSNFEPNDLGESYPAVTCAEQKEETTFLPEDNTNCEIYLDNNNNTFLCQKCKFGISGTVINDDNSDFSYVNCNTNISGCDQNVKYGGATMDSWADEFFGTTFEHLFSCNKCTDNTQIPWVHVKNNGDLEAYGLENGVSIPSQAADKNGHFNACRASTSEGLNIPEEEFVSFPENCGLGHYAIDKAKHAEIGKYSVNCFACKPGFKKVFNGVLISGCTEIPNCNNNDSNSGWFNMCKQCNEGYVWAYSNGKVHFDQCVSHGDSNCLAVENEVCMLCDKGYHLNHDNVCEMLTVQLCQSFTHPVDLMVDSEQVYNQGNLYQYLNPKGPGCNQCSSGVSVQKTTDFWACVNSPFLIEDNFGENTNYIANCSKYYHHSEQVLKCAECDEGYALNFSHSQCYLVSSNSSYSNCGVISDPGNECISCNVDYVLINGSCQAENIGSCAEYFQDTSSQICKLCDPGFKIVNNQCVSGHIDFCNVYVEGKCSECNEGYALVILNNSEKVCLEISVDLNCSQGYFTQLSNQFNCQACSSNYLLSNNQGDNWPKSACLPLNQVANCVSYNKNFTSDLECNLCAEGFWLNESNQCVDREASSEGCLTFMNTKDECATCSTGYFLENGLCNGNPDGVFNCVDYSNATTCSLCKTMYYLEANECKKSDEVVNCLHYSGQEVCETCNPGKVLVDNVCDNPVALNCATYASKTECATCEDGKGLETDQENNVNCVNINLDFCLESTTVSPFECTMCDSSHYVKDGVCAGVTTVNGCAVYDSETTCSKCNSGLVLSIDKQSCTQLTGTDQSTFNQCEDISTSSSPECTICLQGYLLDTGVCVECTQNTLQEGCSYCNPADQTKCLICKSGYYASTDQTCSENADLINVTPEPTNPDSVFIGKIISIILFVLFLN